MSVVFKVECRETKPGDSVFVVGSHQLLGDFNPLKGVCLRTSAEDFPLWTSDPIALPVGADVEYKFLVQLEDLSGAAKWEKLKETNRPVTAVAGLRAVVRTTWGVYRSELTMTVDDSLVKAAEEKSNGEATEDVKVSLPLLGGYHNGSEPAVAGDVTPAEARQRKESLMMEMAESGADDARAQVPADSTAGVIMSRENIRRNFSQSLMSVGWGSNDNLAEVAAEDLKGVGLKHITSFSALSLMAEAAEKDKARAARNRQPQYEPHSLDVPVVIVTSEIAPWSKTGGLGLVASSYSYEFPRSGHRTMVVAPKYKHYDGIELIGETTLVIDGKNESVKYWHLITDSGCDCVFVDHPAIERGGGIYCNSDGREFPDNLFRFTILSMAALEAPLLLKISGCIYGEKVVFLANDWQAGLVPLYMRHKYRKHNVYTQARVIYVVHNLGYQGQYGGVNACKFFGVDQLAANDLALGSAVNLSKAALVCADRVLTVSPNYAQEIQSPVGGFGLQDFVKAKAHSQRLSGILNGIDEKWNPQTDAIISRRYSIDNFVEGKQANKAALQEILRLEQNADCVLIGFTGRLTSQKGVDVLGTIVPWLMEDTGNGVTGNCQLIMMGNGEKQYGDVLRWAERTYPGRVCGYVGFDPEVEHKIMAGCDLFLMPSRYEPCGLPQMCSQQYGTLPIVTATGGLKDSVKDVSVGAHIATGFHIPSLDQANLKATVFKASALFVQNREAFQAMQRNAMQTDFFWTRAIDEYEAQIDVTLFDAPSIR